MEMHFTLSSPAFEGGDWIHPRYTCEGQNTAPPLEWSHVPVGVRSFALIMDDPDAPSGTFTHWIQWDIPAETRSLAGASSGVAGVNDFHGAGYGGPCPPPNHGTHRYYFRLYALDVDTLDLPPESGRARLEEAMAGHVVAEDALMGRFQR
jgi:hypothetical protein